MHRLLSLVEPSREREPRRVALDGQDLVRHGHRVVHHEPPREGRDVARLVLALDRRVGVERRPQLLEPLEERKPEQSTPGAGGATKATKRSIGKNTTINTTADALAPSKPRPGSAHSPLGILSVENAF